MQHRIRVAAIIIENKRILLVRHVHPVKGDEWWVPPGGGLEDSDESIFDCAVRETREETGLEIAPHEILYLREFTDLEFQRRNLEIFLRAEVTGGELVPRYAPPAGHTGDYAQGAAWVSRAEMEGMTIYPTMLAEETFWQQSPGSPPGIQYLGKQAG
jgi:8-oxo-dGTP diphosphatase